MQVQPWRAGRKEWQKGVVKSRIDKRSYEAELPQGLLRRNHVELRKSSTETREDTREQAPPDTRVETFDQPRDPLCLLKPKSSFQRTEFHSYALSRLFCFFFC